MPKDVNINLYMNMNQRSVQKSVSTFGKLERTLATLGYRAARTSALLDRHIVDPLKRIAQVAVDSSTTLSRSLGEVQTLLVGSLSDTTSRMEGFKSDLRSLSIEVVKDMNDLTKGLYEYISAFQELPNTMEGFTIAAKVARAGITSTQQAVDLLSSVALAYGDTATATQQKIADLSFETVRLAKTHIPELAANVSKVAPIFAIMGLSMEQVFGVASTLIGITGDTTEVFTQMRRIVLSMQKPNRTMVSLLNAIGYSGAFAGKELLADSGLVGAIKQLNIQAAEMGVSIEKAVGRIQGIMPALAFQLQSVQDRYDTMMLSINAPGGATESALEKAIMGIAAQTTKLDRAKLALQNIGRDLGDRLIPLLAKFYDMLVVLLDRLLAKQSFPALEWLLKQFQWLTEAVGNLSEGWTKFLTTFAVSSVIISPVLGMIGVALFSIETSITLIRSAVDGWKAAHAALNIVLAAHGGLIRTIIFSYGRWSAQLAIIQKQMIVLSGQGITGIRAYASALSFAGVKATILSLVPWLALAAVIAGIVVLLVKLHKHLRNKAIANFRQDADDAIASFDKLTEATVNYGDALKDINAITDVFAQKQEYLALLLGETAELLSIRAGVDNLRAELAEYQSILDNYEPKMPTVRYAVTETLYAVTGIDVKVPPEIVAAKEAIANLRNKILEADIRIRDLVIHISELKFNLLPEADAKALKKRIEAILGDFTFSSGAFEIDVLLGTSDLNKLNDLLGIAINPLAESFQKISDAIVDVEFKAQEADAEIKRLNETLALVRNATDDESLILTQAIPLKIEALKLYKQAIEATLVELQKYFDISDKLSEQTASFTTAFLAVTQEMNKYTDAIADNITIQEKLDDATIPEDVKERLRFMLDANDDLIASYKEELWLLKAKASIPASVSGLDSVEAIVIKVKESNKKVAELTKGLTAYKKKLKDMIDSTTIGVVRATLDTTEIEQTIAEIEEEIESATPKPDLTNIETGLEAIETGLADYNEALDKLSGDTTKYGALEFDYLNKIVDGYEDKVKALQDVERIMNKMPKTFKGISGFEDAWLKYNQDIEETAQLTNDLALAQFMLNDAIHYGGEVDFLISYIEELKEALGLTVEFADKVDDVVNSLYSGDIFEISFNITTGKFEIEATEMGANIVAVFGKVGTEIGNSFDVAFNSDKLAGFSDVAISAAQDLKNEYDKIYTGNINMFDLPEVDMPGGKTGTVYSATIELGDGWVNIPTIFDGILHDEEEARARFAETGKHLGIYEMLDEAEAMATKLSSLEGIRIELDPETEGALQELTTGPIEGWIRNLGNGLKESAKVIWDNGKEIMGSLGNMVLSKLLENEDIQKAMNGIMEIISKLVEVLGPAIGNILEPIITIFGKIGTLLGLMLLPILEALTPLFDMLAIIFEAILVPVLQLLAPGLAMLAGVIEFLMPIIAILAKAIIVLTAPFQYFGSYLSWAADMIRTAFHNIAEWIAHPFSESNRDTWEFPELDEALEETTDKIKAQLDAVDEAMKKGIGDEDDKKTDSPTYYEDIYKTPLGDTTNPLAGDEGGSGGGSSANIEQMTQYNYITVNTGALVGSDAFDEFVQVVSRRLNELKEVS